MVGGIPVKQVSAEQLGTKEDHRANLADAAEKSKEDSVTRDLEKLSLAADSERVATDVEKPRTESSPTKPPIQAATEEQPSTPLPTVSEKRTPQDEKQANEESKEFPPPTAPKVEQVSCSIVSSAATAITVPKPVDEAVASIESPIDRTVVVESRSQEDKSVDSSKSGSCEIPTRAPADAESQERSIQSEQHAEILSTASEIQTVSPVPIQVAESVLQAEPKESVSSSETSPVSQGVLSTTVTPVHESSGVATTVEGKIQMNGSSAPIDSLEIGEDVGKGVVASPDVVARPVERPAEQPTLLEQTVVVPEEPLQREPEKEERPEPVTEAVPKVSEAPQPVPLSTTTTTATTTTTTETRPEPIAETGQRADEAPESVPLTVAITSATASTTATTETTPVRPTRAKELSIPATPTVTEPTPPTSPPVPSAEDPAGLEKEQKKESGKKAEPEGDSTEAAEGDVTEKKTKKVTKKVTKKPKPKAEEGQEEVAEGSSSAGKQKKTVKVTKKAPKSSLGAEAPVPETPPPGSSEAPVPPKRKAKSTGGKSAGPKKPEADQ